MDRRKTTVGFFLFGGGTCLRACIRHTLHSAGLWVVFFPVVVLGQVQTSNVQFRIGVPALWASINPNLQELEEREREVITTTLFSDEPYTALFEAIRVSEGELSQGSPAPFLPFFPHGDQAQASTGRHIDPTGGIVGDRLHDFEQVLGNAQKFSAIFGGDSKVAITRGRPPLDTEDFAMVTDELPSEKEFTAPSPVMAKTVDSTVIPNVCLKLSPMRLVSGDPVTVTATVDPVQKKDIMVKIDFPDKLHTNILERFISINPSTITIPAGAKESAPVQYATSWDYKQTYVVVDLPLRATPDLPNHIHSSCLCPILKMDRPTPTVTLSASPNPVDDGDPVTISAKIPYALSSDLKVPLHYPNANTTDTAFDPGDYTKLDEILIKANQNFGIGKIQTREFTAVEDKIFTVAIDGKKLAATVVMGDANEVKVTITDDEDTYVIVDKESSVSEDKGTHDVTVSLTNKVHTTPFTLNYTLDKVRSTATEGKDFTITNSGSVQVPARAASVTIPIEIVDDSEDEPDETVILKLTAGTGYELGSSREHTVTIVDNDPTVYFASATSSAEEGIGTQNVRVTLASAPVSDLTLSYTLSGTAVEGTDYTIKDSGSVPVSAGATSVNIPVAITDDSEIEPDEDIILTLTSATGYTVGSQKEHTLTIADNDTPEARFASATGSVKESDGTHTVSVEISPSPASDFTLSYTLGGTATRNTDYTITGSVLVSANATLVNIPVTIIDDQLDELDETVILTLTSGTGYSVGSPSEHELTIED
ncbi:MAG: hypothetical protein F4Z62_06495, partial [Rhodothermaceae bacterium]|nr:hypothetical protein [Rhodothermaceae bacterium]MYE62501.1 hypothetical protein [Rhodothermaceae bacterium]